MKVKLFLGLVLFALLLPQKLQAQQADSSLYRIEMKDGNVYIGTIISENDEAILFRSRNIGDIELKKINIKHREKIDPSRLKNGEYWFENPHATRYLFGTNGLSLKKGEGYYQNAWIFFNNLNYGLSENVSVGAGFVPVFLFGVNSLPVWIMPKVSIPLRTENLHVAVGGLFGGVIGVDDGFGLGIAYGVVSYGNSDSNVTLGMGLGYAGGDWGKNPIFTLSGMHRIKNKLYLISENYFVFVDDESGGMLSLALRWAPQNFAVDFGLFRPTGVGGSFIGAPWLGVSIPF